MSSLDPRIEAVRVQYDLQKTDFWQIPQNKQWVCKHAALEVVAAKAKIVWSAPTIIEADTANGIAVLSVTGTLADRSEWSTGEASPKNNKNAYPWAMAEKRAKDRVVLKLVGIHGLVYSEDEADDFKKGADREEAPAQAPAATSAPKAASRDLYGRLSKANRELKDVAAFDLFWSNKNTLAAVETLPKDWAKELEAEKADKFAELEERAGMAGEDDDTRRVAAKMLKEQFGS